MTETAAPSPIFRHFVSLKKDSKYYLTLLKIRETEIQRCSKAYRDIQDTLECCLGANVKLKGRITLLEHSLIDADASKRKENESYRRQVCALTRNLTEMKRGQDGRTQELENEYKRKMLDMEKMYTEDLNRKELEFEKKIEEGNVKLQREIMMNTKLKNEVESLMNNNTSLKNEVRLLKSKHVSDQTALELELSSAQDVNKSLSTEVLRVRRDLDRTIDQAEKYRQQIADYQTKLERESSRYDNAHRENKDSKRINSKLNNEVIACRSRNKELRVQIDELLGERGRLKSEIERLKIMANAKPIQIKCNVPEHGKYEEVSKQNAVLQEIVKTMRRERTNKENKDLRNAENRIEKLEGAIEVFKKNILLDSKLSMESVNRYISKKGI